MVQPDHSAGAAGRAAGQIRELILQRLLVPGEQVRQEDIAGQINMSRGPIREALHMLAAEGALRYVRNRGYFVSQFTADEMRQLYRVRDLLESEILISLPRPSSDQLEELQTINERIRSSNVTLDEVIRLNREFHELIMSASELNVIKTEVEQVGRMSLAYQAMSINFLSGWALVAADHDGIITALAAGDSDTLVHLSRAHRERSLARLLPLLR